MLSRLGPGLITGAADDDPSGIGTYSQVGAQFGYGLSWSLLFSLPFMTVIQDVAAQIGSVTGAGIAANLRRHYPRPLLWCGGVAAAVRQRHQPRRRPQRDGRGDAAADRRQRVALYTLAFGILCLVLEIFLSYRDYAAVLKCTTLSLFAYVAVVLTVARSLGPGADGAGRPARRMDRRLSPPASSRSSARPSAPICSSGRRRRRSRRSSDTMPSRSTSRRSRRAAELARIRHRHADRHGVQQHRRGVHRLRDRRDSATRTASRRSRRPPRPPQALRPVAGRFAFLLFAFGIIGTGLLAVPVLAGSAAYAVTEMLGRPASLDAKPLNARALLRNDRRDDAGRRVDPICRDQPGPRALLERGDQRRARRAADGADDADRHNPRAMGHLTLGQAEADPRLGRNGGDGARDEPVLRLAVLALSSSPAPWRSASLSVS